MANFHRHDQRIYRPRLRGIMILLLQAIVASGFLSSSSEAHPLPRPHRLVAGLSTHTRSLRLRGGSSDRAVNIRARADKVEVSIAKAKNNKNNKKSKEEPPQDVTRGMSLALGVTCLTVMGAKCALPSVLSLLTTPKVGLTYPAGKMLPIELLARQLTISTLAIAAGKLVLGPVIDRFGGILCLKVALALLGGAMGLISYCQSFRVFAVAWIFVDFIFSSCWAGCINAIHQVFPKHQWAPQIGTMAAAGRTGNAISFTLFGWILHWATPRFRQSWRPVFATAALMQVIPLVLLFQYGKPTATASDTKNGKAVEPKPSFLESLRAVKDEFKALDFWLHLTSRSSLMIFASFLLFVPTLMTQVYQTTSSVAAQAGTIFSLGCLLSVTIGSGIYPRLKPRRGKLRVIASLLGVAILTSLSQLGHVAGWWSLSPTAAAGALFLWGVGVATPFYIPPSLYALERGKSSATIADVFDIAGFGLLALFNGYVAGIPHSIRTAWIPTFQLTTFCALASFTSLLIAVWREGREDTL